MRKHIGLALLATCLLGADKPVPMRDAEQMTGTWAVVKAVRNGTPAEQIDQVKVVINKGELHFVTAGKNSPTARLTLNPSANPPAIDLVPSDGGYKGKPMAGIYELRGDRLRLCFAVPGKKRPAAFASRAKSGHLLLVLKRAKLSERGER
jgi:uncharacterized protein (TIGR03067 family)